jgi:hypothetical protein
MNNIDKRYMATRPASAGVPQNGRVLGAGCWVMGYTQASTATATLLRPSPRLLLLSCWSVCAAGLHPSMPACQQPGMLACWGACQQDRHSNILRPPPSLAGHQPACQHAFKLNFFNVNVALALPKLPVKLCIGNGKVALLLVTKSKAKANAKTRQQARCAHKARSWDIC